MTRTHLIRAAALLMTLAASAVETNNTAFAGPPGRPRLPLAGAWRVHYVTVPAAAPGDAWETKTFDLPKPITLPAPSDRAKPETAVQGVWFERAVVVPAEWQGRRTVIRVPRARYGVGITVNGKEIGEIPGYGGALDLTEAVTPGSEAVIRIYAGRAGSGLKTLDRIVRAFAEFGGHHAGPTGIFGPADEFRMESLPREASVDDVWYRTFVRGGARIDPLVTFHAAAARGDLICRIDVYEPGADKPVATHEAALGATGAGENRYECSIPATALRLWDLLQPNLYYGQATLLTAAGAVVDRSDPVRFGVREIWTQGRLIYLNHHLYCPVPASADSLQMIGALAATGVTAVQDACPYFFRFIVDNRDLARICDELGVALSAIGLVHHDLNLADPEVFRDYQRWARHYYRRFQNHPSIVVYGLGINAPGNCSDFGPEKMGRAANMDWTNTGTTRSYLVGKATDPTRLYYFHGGPRGGDIGSGNFYPNHMPIQEVEDWPLEWVAKGDRPWMTHEGLLSTFNVDLDKGGTPYAAEFAARLAGDAAYAAESDAYRHTFNYLNKGSWSYDESGYPLMDRYRAETLLRGGRVWRYCGIGFQHWAGALGSPGSAARNPLMTQAAYHLRQPAMAWIGGPAGDITLKDHNFYAGEVVKKTVLGINDQHTTETWTARWEVRGRDGGAVVAGGVLRPRVSPFSRVCEPFAFTLPAGAATAALDLRLDVAHADGSPLTNDTFALAVYPRPEAPGHRGKTPFLLFDPHGETAPGLAALGVRTKPLIPGAARAGRVLLMGRRALRGLKQLPFTADEVARGLRVVFFEQHCSDLDKIGLRHEDRGPRQLFARQPGHPLADGLTADLLRDWRGHATLFSAGPVLDRIPVSSRTSRISTRGNVASAIIETPHCGPFETFIDGEFDLSYTPLVRWRHGRGELLFCQLDLTGRIGVEPGADRAAANLIRYLGEPLPPPEWRTAACLSASTAEHITRLGFAAETVDGRLDSRSHSVVATAADAAAFAARRAEIEAFVARGGDLIVLYADAALLADPFFGGRLRAEPVRYPSGNLAPTDHPMLRGAGPQNLHWRSAVDLVRVASADPVYVPLLDGFAGVLPAGKGRILLFQADPARFTEITAAKAVRDTVANAPAIMSDARLALNRNRTRWQVARLHSVVLANAGLRSSDALVQRLFDIKPGKPDVPINYWMVLGPFPMPEGVHETSTVHRAEIDAAATHRDPSYEWRQPDGTLARWRMPTDSANGLGLNGLNDWGKIYGVKIRQSAVGVTWVWSTRARTAAFGFGADWWFKIVVNSKEIDKSKAGYHGHDINFNIKRSVPLKAGWNEIVATVAAGSNGHLFWLQIDNPGDLVVAQQLQAPTEPPPDLPPVEDLIPDVADPGFSPYIEPMTVGMDPYTYMPW